MGLNEMRIDKDKFRKKAKEQWEKEWIEEALRARKFSELDTFEQGLKLIKFAIKFRKAAENAGHG